MGLFRGFWQPRFKDRHGYYRNLCSYERKNWKKKHLGQQPYSYRNLAKPVQRLNNYEATAGIASQSYSGPSMPLKCAQQLL